MLGMAWRKLFGLLCFLSSFGLFGFIWLLNKQRADFRRREIVIYETDLEHLSRDRRCNCVNVLVKIENKLLKGDAIEQYVSLFNKYCFKLPIITQTASIKELISTFDADAWKQVYSEKALHSVIDFLFGHNPKARDKIIDNCVKALGKHDLDQVTENLNQIYEISISPDCLKWKANLGKLQDMKDIIRRAGCKLFCD